MTNKTLLIISMGCAAVALSGCSSVKHSLGLDHYQADEFSVPSNPPLSMPPDYTLLPPAPGAKGPNTVTPEEKAQINLTGAKLKPESGASQSEKSLVKEASKTTAKEENVRERMNKEAEASDVNRSKPIMDRIADNLTGATNEAPSPASTATTKPKAEKLSQ